jgi:hypothetical protein
MSIRFEFDFANKILLARLDGRLTDESLEGLYRASRKYSIATDASAAIADFSSVTELAASSQIFRELARREPAVPDPTRRPRIFVTPQTEAFGLLRMFQIVGEDTRPLLSVVRTMDEALATLGIQSAHFEPLE